MKITELKNGTNVDIEIVNNEKKFLFTTKVIGQLNGFCVADIYKHNETIPVVLNSKTNKNDIVFNVYTIDSNTKQRLGWRNVQIETIDSMYVFSTFQFAKESGICDRRIDERIKVDTVCEIQLDDNTSLSVDVFDISRSGIAFWLNEEDAKNINVREKYKMYFQENVSDQEFEFSVEAKVVRKNLQNNKILVGCMLFGVNKNYLLYYCKKYLENKYKNRMDINLQVVDGEESIIVDF